MARKTIDERLAEAEQRLKQIKEQARKQKAREQAAAKKRERQEDTNRKIRHLLGCQHHNSQTPTTPSPRKQQPETANKTRSH